MRFVSQYRFSPTGVFEQDDMDNWIQVTAAARSVIGRRFPANYQMGVSEETTETDLRGRLTSRWSDSNQLSLYMILKEMDEGRGVQPARPTSTALPLPGIVLSLVQKTTLHGRDKLLRRAAIIGIIGFVMAG